MKKLSAFLMSLVMVAGLLAGCGGGDKAATSDSSAPADSAASANKVVKIGVFEPQTGDNGAGGKQEVLGMQYANSVAPTVDIIRETYKHRCDVMLDAMDKYFPPEAKYTQPDGGLFTKRFLNSPFFITF